MMKCSHCGSEATQKNGITKGIQRCKCKTCGRTFSMRSSRKSADDKNMALLMYMNNVGIRKTALFLGVSPPTILNWITEKHRALQEIIGNIQPETKESADIIELDEIYTFIQKRGGGQQYGLLILAGKSALLRL